MGKRKVLEGVVVSDKMNKTRVVLVVTHLVHHLYTKLMRKRKKYKVHDEGNASKIGDRVKIRGCRPYSKETRFELLEILK